MQPCFDRSASFSVFNEHFGLEQNTNQSLWSQINGMRLNLCTSMGKLVKPLHKKIFSKLIFATIFATYWNHVYLFFRSYTQDVCDNWEFHTLWSFLLCQLNNKHARISYFVIYYLTKPPCPEEACYKLSMLSRYAPWCPSSKFCEYSYHCELHLCLTMPRCLNTQFIIQLSLIKCMLDDILFELTLMSCDSA